MSEMCSRSDVEGQMLVLASGGMDSSTIIGLVAAERAPSSAIFIDYGQAAAQAEEVAVQVICSHYAVDVQIVRCHGMRFGPGEIRGRNAFLLHTALMSFSGSSGTILLGVHSGTGYLDCNADFVELMQRSFEFHTGGALSVTAPFIDWSKADVSRLADELGVPLQDTYSCESGNRPCGECGSCRDRKELLKGQHASEV